MKGIVNIGPWYFKRKRELPEIEKRDFSKQMRAVRKKLREAPDAVNKPIAFWLTLPPSVNEMYRTSYDDDGKARRRLTGKARAWKKEAADIAWAEARSQKWQICRHTQVVVEIFTWWPDKSRARDVHNLDKALMDALEGVIYSNDRLALPRHMGTGTDERRPRVELKIWQEGTANA